MNIYCNDFLERAIAANRKNGNYLMSDDNRQLIRRFLDFDINNDWLDSKYHTKIGKVLASIISMTPTSSNDALMLHLYGSIDQLTLQHQRHLSEDYYKYKDYTADQLVNVKETIRYIELLTPILDKYKSISKRLMRNGKFPKDEEDRIKKQAIKGKMNPIIAEKLTVVKKEWIDIIYDNKIKYYNKTIGNHQDFLNRINTSGFPRIPTKESAFERKILLKLIAEGMVVQPVPKVLKFEFNNQENLAALAMVIAVDEGESFYFKMADKLGGLVTDMILQDILTVKNNTPFSSHMRFVFDNGSFGVENKIIVNTSPLGNSFYQYPCTFYNIDLMTKEGHHIKKSVMSEREIKDLKL